VRAAFALYGGAAPERLSAEPLRVVDDLLAGIDRMETAARQARQQQARSHHEPEEVRQQAEALEALGLHWGATSDAVKAAHRRLVKRHHPDMGGDAEAFRRINAAYQWLTA
jgi:DnaJ-class molecular chaperone